MWLSNNDYLPEFASVTILVLDEHLFGDAEEESVLVLAEQLGNGPGIVRIGNAKREGLLLNDAINKRTRILPSDETQRQWRRGLFHPQTLALYDELSSRFGTLGNLANIRIGVVTGRNEFFLVSAETREKMRIEDIALRPVISKTAELRSLKITPNDISDNVPQLFVPPTTDLPSGAALYIKHGEKTGVNKGYKCAQRTPWYLPLDTEPPDAFLSCMIWENLRLVVNCTEAVCTNTLLAVSFQPELDNRHRTAYAVGAHSSIAQLSAEIEGRVSGGGLLKLEPMDARRLVIPPVILNSKDQAQLDGLCRAGQWDDARMLVDEQLSGTLVSKNKLGLIKTALERARTRRRARR